MPDTPLGQTNPSVRSDKDAWLHRAIGVKVKTAAPSPSGGADDAATPAAATPTSSLGPAGSDQQSQQFRAAVEEQLNVIDGHLAYTAEHAEPAKHQPMAAQREVLVSAYAVALKQIDPDKPAAGKGAVDKVLGAAKALAAKVAQFRQVAEKAYNDWQARQPKYDEAGKQIAEMAAWGHAQAAAMQSQLDALKPLLEGRAYVQASAALDKFLPQLKPVYDDYLKQKAAQEQYDPARKALDPRIAAAEVSNFKKLEPLQQEFPPAVTAMDDAAGAKNFVQALQIETELTGKVTLYEQKLAELTQQKQDYETEKKQLQPKLDQNLTGPPRKPVAQMLQDLQSEAAQMESSAQTEDFVAALNAAKDLGPKVDAYAAAVTKLEEQQKAYEDAVAPLRDRITKTAQPTYKELADVQSAIADLNTKMGQSESDEDYVAALADTKDLAAQLDAFEKRVQEIDDAKKQFMDARKDLDPKLAKVAQPPHVSLAADEKTISDSVTAMESAAGDERFDDAVKMAGDLNGKIDAYATAVAKLDEQKQAYDDARKEVQPKIDAINQTRSDSVATMQQTILSTVAEIDKDAQAEEYEDAVKLIATLTKMFDDYDKADASQLYVVEYQNQKYYGTQQELVPVRQAVALAAIREAHDPLKHRAEAQEGRYNDLKKLNETGINQLFAAVVTTLGGAKLSAVAAALATQKQALDGLNAAITGDAAKAEPAYKAAVSAINAMGLAINTYMDALEGGAETTITVLQVIEVAAFTLAGALGAAALVPAGGFAATAGANALAGAGFSGLETAAQKIVAPAAYGDKVDWAHAGIAIGKAAFVGGVSGALGTGIGKAITKAAAEKIFLKYAVTNPVVQESIKDTIEGGIGGVVSTIASSYPDLRDGTMSWEKFLGLVVAALIAGKVGGLVGPRMQGGTSFSPKPAPKAFR